MYQIPISHYIHPITISWIQAQHKPPSTWRNINLSSCNHPTRHNLHPSAKDNDLSLLSSSGYILFHFFFHHATMFHESGIIFSLAGIFTLVHTLLFQLWFECSICRWPSPRNEQWWHFVNLACLNRIGRLFEGWEVTEAAVAASSYVDAIKRGWKRVRGIRRGPGLTSFDDVNQDRVETAQEPCARPNILTTWPSAAVHSAKWSFVIRFFDHFFQRIECNSWKLNWERKEKWKSWFLEGCLE